MKPKLLIVTDNLPPRVDGITRFLQEIIPLLSKDFQIAIIGPDFGDIRTNEFKNIEMIRFKPTRWNLGDFTPTMPKRKLVDQAVKDADIVWSQTIGPIGYIAMNSAKRNKKPLIAYIHSLEWELFSSSLKLKGLRKRWFDKIIKFIIRRLYNKCDMLIVPFIDVGRQLRKQGISTRKAIVHLAVDSTDFIPPKNKDNAKKNIGLSASKVVIGYCGRIAEEKDLGTLYDAFLILRQRYRNLYLLLVGDGPKSIKKRFKGANIKVTGRVEDVPRYLQAMDIFVLPSLTETTSLSTLEAMSCGLPVIATPVGYVKQYITNKQNGFFFPKSDIDALMNRLDILIQKDKLRERVGKRARSLAKKGFSWDKSAKQISVILKKMV